MKKFNDFNISENLKYHIDNNLSVYKDNIFRYGSEEYLALIKEAEELEIYWDDKNPIFADTDSWCLKNLKTGVKAINRQGEEVILDLPKRGGKRKYIVWRDSGVSKDGKIIATKIEFGDPNATIKNGDLKRAKSFWARHQCDLKKDPNTAGFWSCYGPSLFTKNLELVSDKPW